MAFDVKKHLIDLKGKKYLETKWRLVWFRDDHPCGKVSTEVVNLDPLVIRASVMTAEGEVLATGHGSAQVKQGAVWNGREIEKAETAAIGRALGHAGYGTQFEGNEERNYLADSPVERRKPSPAPQPAPAPPAPLSEVPRPKAEPAASSSGSGDTDHAASREQVIVDGKPVDSLDAALDQVLNTPVEGTQWIDVTAIQRLRAKNDKSDYFRLKSALGMISAFSTTALTALGLTPEQCEIENKVYPLATPVQVPYFEKVIKDEHDRNRNVLELDHETAKLKGVA